MTSQRKTDLPSFEIAILGTLLLIGWAVYQLYEMAPQADLGREQLAGLRDEYLEIADHVKTNVVALNLALTNILQDKSGVELEQFHRRNEEFSQWISDKERHWSQSPMKAFENSAFTNQLILSGSQMLPLLGRIRLAHSNYSAAARYLASNTAQPLLIRARLAASQRAAGRETVRLLSCAREARLFGTTVELSLLSSQGGYGTLQHSLRQVRFALLVTLIGVSSLLLFGLYRRRAARSRALIQEHSHQHLEQQAKLEKLAHFSKFAREFAHEIKQPLTAINAHLYTLQKSLVSGTPSHKDAAVIRSEINRLDRIVKDFLALARPAEPTLAPMDGADVLDEIRDLVESQFAEEGKELKCHYAPGLHILGDTEQLKQVLLNLVKNAGESVQRGGSVTLLARRTEHKLNGGPAEAVIIEVQDTGPGIPPDIQPRIFDPFFSTKQDGTGLGLAIAARIVDRHGGILEFDTEPGKGTTFRIVLPARRKEQLHEPAAAY